jgi:Tol biopolymer transport system component
MKVRLLISLLLLAPLLGAAGVISNELYYTQTTSKSISELQVSDFEKHLDPVPDGYKLPNINAGNLIVMVRFNVDVAGAEFSFQVNGRNIGSDTAFAYSYFIYSEWAVKIDITEWLIPGKNQFHFSCRTAAEIETVSWEFHLTSAIDNTDISDQVKLLPGTDDSNREEALSLSPNYPLLSYLSYVDDEMNIYIHNLKSGERNIVTAWRDTAEEENFFLTEGDDYITAPIWSNIGNYLYYCTRKQLDYTIQRVEVDREGKYKSENQIELTKKEATGEQWIYALAHSPAQDRLVYVSKPDYRKYKPDDKKFVWLVNDLNSVKNADDFMHKDRRKLLYETKTVIYDLDISADGNMLAVCEKNNHKGNTIYIIDLNSGKELRRISENEKQFNYPQWSPRDDYLLYSRQNEVYLYSYKDNSSSLIIDDQRVSDHAVKPAWDYSGKAVYYIANDNLSSIKRITFDDDLKLIKKPEIFLSNDRLGTNQILTIGKNGSYMAFMSSRISFHINFIKLKYEDMNAVSRFFAGRNIRLGVQVGNEWSLLAYQPDLKSKNAWLEKSGLSEGNTVFSFNRKSFTKPLISGQATNIMSDVKPEPDFALRLPYLAQHRQQRLYYRNSHLATTAAAGISLGSGLFMEDLYYDDYFDVSTSGKALFEKRSQTAELTGFNKTQWENLTAMTLLAFIDASYIRTKPDKINVEKHKANYEYQKTVNKANSLEIMSGITNVGSGQIKINCYEPNTKIHYRQVGSPWIYAGKSNFIMDPDTYFTIGNLKEGKYEVKCSLEFKEPKTYTAYIKEYHNYYIYNKFSSLSSGFNDKIYAFVPGWQQAKRGQYLKSIAYLGLSIYSGWQAFESWQASDDDYEKYQSSTSQKDMLHARSSERENHGKLIGYSIMFSFNYINNLLDVFLKD